MTNSRRSSS